MNEKQRLCYLRVAESALENSVDLLNAFIRDCSNEEGFAISWEFTHGSIAACIDFAHEYFYKFSAMCNEDSEN